MYRLCGAETVQYVQGSCCSKAILVSIHVYMSIKAGCPGWNANYGHGDLSCESLPAVYCSADTLLAKISKIID